MTRLPAWVPRGTRLAVPDVLLVLWAAAWIAMGVAVAEQASGLASLSETVVLVGAGVRDAGNALGLVEGVPLVGEQLAEPARRVEEIGQSAIANGRRSRESADELATLLGISIALIPSLPLLAFYLPARVAAIREARALRRTLTRMREDPGLPELLARRALLHASYRELARLQDPLGDLRAGRYEPLVEAELERLGVQPTWLRAPSSSRSRR